MVALALVRSEQGAPATPSMTADEARACVDAVRASLYEARRLLLDMRRREGWRALGYPSWVACVTAEFGRSVSSVYRAVAAGEIALILSPRGELERVPERHLRPLAKLRSNPDAMRFAWQIANTTAPGGKLTGEWMERTVETVQESITTGGHVDVGGRQTAIAAAITHAEHERMLRQEADLAGKVKPLLNAIYPDVKSAALGLSTIRPKPGKWLRLVLWEYALEGDEHDEDNA